jgi:hypothetical protein
MTPQQFVTKWRESSLKESAGSQAHFIDPCRMLGEKTPAEADPSGSWYAFEKGATKAGGGDGWADVWKRGCFAWEYKGKGKDLGQGSRLGDEVFETPENKADVAAAKRRSRFQLSMIGVPIGATLHLARDPNITCTTVDDRNQVEFNGDVTSLSDAAIQAFRSLGYDVIALSGPWAWTWKGRRLDEIRREIEEGSD